jgi:hypothetical protein
MDLLTTNVLAAVVLATVAGLAYVLALAWQHVLGDTGPLPLYDMIRRHGLTAGEATDELGLQRLAYAARRCAFCSDGGQCQRRMAAGEPAPAGCPNLGLFAYLTRPRV